MTPRQVISKAGLRAGETQHRGRAFRRRVTALSRSRGPHWQAPGERGEGSGVWTGPRGAVIRRGLEVDDSPRVIGYRGATAGSRDSGDQPGVGGMCYWYQSRSVSVTLSASRSGRFNQKWWLLVCLNLIILPATCLYFKPLVTLWHIVPPMHYRSSCFSASRARKQ